MPVSRTFVSALRTSRLGLSQSRGANPVNRVFGHDRFAARTYATAFERNKPHVNIGKSQSAQINEDDTDQGRYNWPR